jgi:RNA polymerase sigma factor (sigma-70 family)
MKCGPSGTFVRELDILYQVGTVSGLTDRELLGRFTTGDGVAAQRAFEAIVDRHGPMVLGLCRRVVGDGHSAEDAFQATFLVLALKAGTIRQRNSLGPWLHGVAWRISRRARSLSRRGREKPPGPASAAVFAPVGSEVETAELHAVLDEEINRLPGTYRRTIVLCYLEGKSQEVAARELGWTRGTLSGRLARAKDLLRSRLTRRGFAPSPMVVEALLAHKMAAALVPVSLACATVRQAVSVLLGRAETLAATSAADTLARATLRAMLLNKLKPNFIALLLIGIIAGGAGLLARTQAKTRDEIKASSTSVHSGPVLKDDRADPSARSDRVVITGRVLGPDGKPVPGARVAVVAMPIPVPQTRDLREPERNLVLGSARADALGNFRIELAGSTRDQTGFYVVVGGTGWALAGKYLSAGLPDEDKTVTLQPERILRGRIIDLQGQPIAGVSVRVCRYNTQPYEGIGEAPAWPGPVTTDNQGRFSIRGVGPSGSITLEATSDRHAGQMFLIEPGDEIWNHEQSFALSPAQVIEVRVTRVDDGKPVVGARVNVFAEPGRRRPGARPTPSLQTDARTDDQGRARIIPERGESFWISASPPTTAPYLNQRLILNWPKGAVRQEVALKLERGVPVHGTITEEGSRKPVASALVSYALTRRTDRLYRDFQSLLCEAVSDSDGHFQIVVPPGPGHLLVQAATPDYLHLTTSNLELGVSLLPNWLMYPDALAHIDLKAGQPSHEVTMRLRRGISVAGRVIRPDGSAVARAIAFGRTYVPYNGRGSTFGAFNGGYLPEINVRDGRFEIPGCDPAKPSTFYFFDREHQLGATVELGGKPAENGPVVIQLKKCGSARVRYQDLQGKPIIGHEPALPRRGSQNRPLMLIITPGDDSTARDKTMADMASQVNLDTERMRALRTGADGRVTMESLIPGATYRFHGHEFTAEAGKTIELPDVTISQP